MPTLTSIGLTVPSLLQNASPESLHELIGPSAVDTIKGLETSTTADQTLGELAAQLIEPADVLSDPSSREQIIYMMPLPKAHELAKRLGVSVSRNVYSDLAKAVSKKSCPPKMLSFFGISLNERAPGNSQADASQVNAGYPLYDYQRTVSNKVFRVLTSESRKVVLHMPTGAGKTRTAMHILASYFHCNEPTVVCWLAQSAELLDQAANEFCTAWKYLGNRHLSIGRFWGDHNTNILDINDGLVIAGLGKMVALDRRDCSILRKFADRATLTVIDEAHQSIAPTYAPILQKLYRKRPRNKLLGLTATPGRSWADTLEDKKLSDFFDGFKITLDVDGWDDPVSFLIKEKYLAKVSFKTLELNPFDQSTHRLIHTDSDIPESALKCLGDDVQRNLSIIAAIEDLTLRHNRIIVFAPSVESARLIAAASTMLRGKKAYAIIGTTPTPVRERIIQLFKGTAEEPMVLVNYGVLTTGFDAPATSAAIIARPTHSLVLYCQMVGRAMRGQRVGGNEQAEIITVIDSHLPGFRNIAEAFNNWEDVWNE